MEGHKIQAHKITKPIQLMAVWFIALSLVDSVFLTAAAKISEPAWISPTLVVSAIVFVPLFLGGVFLMQTVFRKELQEDQYYAEWLKSQGETFKDFKAENIKPSKNILNFNAGNVYTGLDENLENQRIQKYEKKQGLFLIHSWRPSLTTGQVADIVIWLHQHGDGPLTRGEVEKVEYELGHKFFDEPQVKTNAKDFFRLEVSAYGPMLCLARVFLKRQTEPIILERYVNFEADEKLRRARYHVENRLKQRKGNRASFDAIRAEVNKTYTDDFLIELIDKNPEVFRTVTIKKGRKPGITLVGKETENKQNTT